MVDLREVSSFTSDTAVVFDLVYDDLGSAYLSIISEVGDTIIIELEEAIEELGLLCGILCLRDLPVQNASSDDIDILRCCGAFVVCTLPVFVGIGVVLCLTEAR